MSKPFEVGEVRHSLKILKREKNPKAQGNI